MKIISRKLSADAKLGILAVICQLAILVAFKNIFHIQTNCLTGYGPLFVFLVYVISKDQMEALDRNPLYWGAAIIFVTLALLVLYAVQ